MTGAAIVNLLVAVPALASAALLAGALVHALWIRTVPTRLARPTAVCAALSLLSTFGVPATGVSTGVTRASWSLVESGLLLVLIAVVARWSPRRETWLAVPSTALAVAAWPVPLVDGGVLERTGVAVFWLLPALAAIATGLVPRRAARRHRDAVAEARRAQRLLLSRDLHDFVAHDISGIVVQAQAARFVAANDPGQAVLALERIERAGLSALAAMDRTVAMLHGEDAPAPAEPPPGIDQLPALVDRFGQAQGIDVQLRCEPDVVAALSREAGAAAHRIVVEALTNVRRHAPDASRVDVRFSLTPTAVRLQVANDRTRRPSPGRSLPRSRGGGGLGLTALTEHAKALGGTLTAGPLTGGGWRLTAELPTTDRPDRPEDTDQLDRPDRRQHTDRTDRTHHPKGTT
ncbi:sensor histidine kinase [Streptomyces sp. NPDC059816]|uniref:sensor histidine kinase n=1 Tax=Streptomyces sp. NPDC059816 TaxID=3346960 RepID=UPI00364BEF80